MMGTPASLRASTSLTLLSIALALLASSPGAECSRAKRRHLPHAYASQNSAELTREESSIPGVSIWTSKSAAAADARRGVKHRDVGWGQDGQAEGPITRRRAASYGSKEGGLLGDFQVGLAGSSFIVDLKR